MKKLSIMAPLQILLGESRRRHMATSEQRRTTDPRRQNDQLARASAATIAYVTDSSGGYHAFAQQPVQPAQHHVVKPRAKR